MKTIRHENRLWVLAEDHLKALEFAREAAKIVEREECAKVCDEQMEWGEINPSMEVAAGNCADLIRARGQQ